MKITRNALESQLLRFNTQRGDAYQGQSPDDRPERIDLNYAACYGGYCLENERGDTHFTSRMSAKEMHAYLAGMLAVQQGSF